MKEAVQKMKLWSYETWTRSWKLSLKREMTGAMKIVDKIVIFNIFLVDKLFFHKLLESFLKSSNFFHVLKFLEGLSAQFEKTSMIIWNWKFNRKSQTKKKQFEALFCDLTENFSFDWTQRVLTLSRFSVSDTF